MTNLYQVLGLTETLLLEPETVESAWSSLTREKPSPDGEESEIHLARQVLGDPVSRLEHWLALRQVEPERGASMAPDFMDLFSQIHAALEKADSVYDRNRKASSTLAKALLAKEAVAAQLEVQDCLASIHQKKGDRIEQFPVFESAREREELSDAVATLGQLKFLKKWEQQCQERLLQLIEC